MLINTNLSTDNTLASGQNQPRAMAGAVASPASVAVSDLDPSLQRLTDAPSGMESSDWEIHDEQDAGQILESARQGILGQPGTALSAQANQLSQNVLNLLQSKD